MIKLKTAVKAGVALCAGGLVSGEIVYQCLLNVKTVNRVYGLMKLAQKQHTNIFYESPLYKEGISWLENSQAEKAVLPYGKNKKAKGLVIKNTDRKKWIICAHCFCGDPGDESIYAKHYYEKGFGVVIPYMSGHGEDESKYSSMGYYDREILKAFVLYITENYPDCEIFLHGMSMGASAVMLLAGEKLPDSVKCAVCDSGYDTCLNEFKFLLKNYYHLPVFPFLYLAGIASRLHGNFDFKKSEPAKALENAGIPVLFIHCENDNFVPYEMFLREYKSCKSPVEAYTVKCPLHGGGVVFSPSEYFQITDDFIKKHINK